MHAERFAEIHRDIGEGMRIRLEELCRRAGISDRNIRVYHQRGLLPRPHRQGKIGYYGEEHLCRLDMIRVLQSRGFSLDAIAQLLTTWADGGGIEDVLGLDRVVDELRLQRSVEYSPVDVGLWCSESAPASDLLELALAAGILRGGQGGYSAPRAIARGAAELRSLGVSNARLVRLLAACSDTVQPVVVHVWDAVRSDLAELPGGQWASQSERVDAETEAAMQLWLVVINLLRGMLMAELQNWLAASPGSADAGEPGVRVIPVQAGVRAQAPQPP